MELEEGSGDRSRGARWSDRDERLLALRLRWRLIALPEHAPHAAPWKDAGKTPPKGYKYGDKTGASDGLTMLIVASALAGKTKLSLKGASAEAFAVRILRSSRCADYGR